MKNIFTLIKFNLLKRRINGVLRRVFSKKMLAVLSVLFNLTAILILLYIFLLPLYPKVKYQNIMEEVVYEEEFFDEEVIKAKTTTIGNSLPKAKFDVSANRVIIPKIGVNSPIVESKNVEWGLSKGAWRDPQGSMPDRGSNTILTGHRFKYLPPSNLTFYLFDKLVVGDMVSVIWKEKYYYYKVKEIRIVDPTEISILEPTDNSILTMYTCHPIYSQKQRLVVISELMSIEDKGE